MNIETIEYKTLKSFIAACQKNDIRLVKIITQPRQTLSPKKLQYKIEVTVTACSRKSPVLRVFKTTKMNCNDVVLWFEIEGINVSLGEWTKELLEYLICE